MFPSAEARGFDDDARRESRPDARPSRRDISGGETDICAVLGAVDLGYRAILAQDAPCSSSDAAHDALMRLYRERYSQQIELAGAQEIVDAWR
ncbi:hypothetical protein [Methylocella sp.]|uniref:hypothetical protein n=1 Tax=Methylocella sp. TaxID=1978226 RepID=UPI0035B3EA33